jgi:hypothetical protein
MEASMRIRQLALTACVISLAASVSAFAQAPSPGRSTMGPSSSGGVTSRDNDAGIPAPNTTPPNNLGTAPRGTRTAPNSTGVAPNGLGTAPGGAGTMNTPAPGGAGTLNTPAPGGAGTGTPAPGGAGGR